VDCELKAANDACDLDLGCEGSKSEIRNSRSTISPLFLLSTINYHLSTYRMSALTELPESFRPDRPEVMISPDTAPKVELAPGVELMSLVGAANGARNLYTGVASFQPGHVLPYHQHSCTENITVLEGELIVEVEGRAHHLHALDNITIPAKVSHTTSCPPEAAPTRVHVAFAMASPDRLLVEPPIRVSLSSDSEGLIGPEHVVRFKTAKPYVNGPNTEFYDYLNAKMIPGCDLSGGYATFQHGGRLPAHVHDFDESICIVQGKATCNVEGRLYSMSGGATALQPRGRVHYFINETHETMAMIWVYAGPMPVRTEIDERFTQPGVNPWGE